MFDKVDTTNANAANAMRYLIKNIEWPNYAKRHGIEKPRINALGFSDYDSDENYGNKMMDYEWEMRKFIIQQLIVNEYYEAAFNEANSNYGYFNDNDALVDFFNARVPCKVGSKQCTMFCPYFTSDCDIE